MVINEFSSAANPEWVELYNSGDDSYSLQGVILFFDSSSTTTQKLSFCDNDTIPAKAYRLITRPANSYWLSNNADTLILKKEDDVIDSISYGSGQVLAAPSASQSISRTPDGGTWALSNSPSPQGDAVSFDCPTPTSTLTPTPIPTDTPVPTNTPTPKPIPTSIPTARPTVKPNPTSKPASNAAAATSSSITKTGDVLSESSESAEIQNPTVTPQEIKIASDSGNNLLPKILIFIGSASCQISS